MLTDADMLDQIYKDSRVVVDAGCYFNAEAKLRALVSAGYSGSRELLGYSLLRQNRDASSFSEGLRLSEEAFEEFPSAATARQIAYFSHYVGGDDKKALKYYIFLHKWATGKQTTRSDVFWKHKYTSGQPKPLIQ